MERSARAIHLDGLKKITLKGVIMGNKNQKKWSDLWITPLDERYKKASFYDKKFYNFCSVVGVVLILVGLYAVFLS